MTKLSPEEIKARLARLEGWQLNDDGTRLVKPLRVADFVAGVELLQRLSAVAEELDHHPDFHLERFRHVRIEVWTHSVGGLTSRDFELAERIDQLLRSG
ncbi:MAG: 4a-hydroxytetrahydrobiopterin dehydratase [Thermoguttaceae bacterium]|nr:4a-hydroxytetrahydrobiopterin dehydratase [Thermoguttaceae bacterium]MDW8077679.1 4a-hydroxytetrahydrobiopterin dehydratase [Thermoguttaceae bacterium]